MAYEEYPRHMHNKQRGGEPRVVQNDDERDKALSDGFTKEPTHPTSPGGPNQAESIEQAKSQAASDPREVERSGAARADHEAKQNAEQEAKARGDDEPRPEDFIRPGDKPNALNKPPVEKKPEDAIRPDDRPNALNKPKK